MSDVKDVTTPSTNSFFVGRRREMRELTGSLERALSGSARVVTLMGEPGIGKTRTARELCRLAAEREATVLWGRCCEDNAAPVTAHRR